MPSLGRISYREHNYNDVLSRFKARRHTEDLPALFFLIQPLICPAAASMRTARFPKAGLASETIRSAYKTSIAHLFFCDIEMGTR